MTVREALADWLRPPRAHGDVIEDRTVSFLELFYDLVFVVLIAQIAHALAADVSWTGVRNFAVVFVLVWYAWLNGTLYHEVHGGEDGRSRTFIFLQMGLIAVMAVYAGHAADEVADGRGFAIVYAILLLLLAFQWAGVIRHDNPAFRPIARRYVGGMVVMAAAVAATALVDDTDLRVWLWLAIFGVTVLATLQIVLSRNPLVEEANRPTESMSERFGLITIIMLGEVVVGVVDGLSELDERSALAIVTGMVSLAIGMGVWWNYFDFVGRRLPRPDTNVRAVWTQGHMVLGLSIAAAGAGMVSLVEHAGDARTPVATAWLVSGSVSLLALILAALVWTMEERPGRAMVPRLLVGTAVLALVVGALRPPPWLLALLLYGALSVVWGDAFIRHARSGERIAET
ncbi:MAG: low temperature requirement protein A [Actinomycetota bacterium]